MKPFQNGAFFFMYTSTAQVEFVMLSTNIVKDGVSFFFFYCLYLFVFKLQSFSWESLHLSLTRILFRLYFSFTCLSHCAKSPFVLLVLRLKFNSVGKNWKEVNPETNLWRQTVPAVHYNMTNV